MPPRIHTIVMFPKLQPDTLTALYLLRTYGERVLPGVKNAKLEFWSNTPNGKNPKELEEQGYLLIDLGGMFDHHTINEQAKEKKECLSTIVAKYLKIDGFPSIKKVLAWAKRDDLEGKGTVSTDTIDRAFGLPGIIMNLNRLPYYTPLQIVNLILPLIDAHVREEYRRFIEYPNLWKSLLETGKAFTFYLANDYKVAVIQTDEIGLTGFIRNRDDLKLIIVKGSKGHINLITKQDSGLDLVPLITKIRLKEASLTGAHPFEQDLATPGRIESVPEWYYDTAANTLQNGGANPQGITPTHISLGDMVQIVKDTYGTVTKGNLWIKLSQESKENLIQKVPQMFEIPFVDHITLAFGINLESIPQEYIGQEVTMFAYSERWNQQIQAVQVELPEHLKDTVNHPHITLSAKRGVPPVKANDMLDDQASDMKDLSEKIPLKGIIEFFKFDK